MRGMFGERHAASRAGLLLSLAPLDIESVIWEAGSANRSGGMMNVWSRESHGVRSVIGVRRLACLGVPLLALAVFPTIVAARAPIRDSTTLSFSFTDPLFSAACHTPITITVSGPSKATVFLNQAGLAVREIDTQPSATITYTAPANGTSVTAPLAFVLHTSYPGGATIGSSATAKVSGNIGSFFGPPGAGQLVFDATVVGFTPAGIPITAFAATPISQHGNFNKAQKICATLT